MSVFHIGIDIASKYFVLAFGRACEVIEVEGQYDRPRPIWKTFINERIINYIGWYDFSHLENVL